MLQQQSASNSKPESNFLRMLWGAPRFHTAMGIVALEAMRTASNGRDGERTVCVLGTLASVCWVTSASVAALLSFLQLGAMGILVARRVVGEYDHRKIKLLAAEGEFVPRDTHQIGNTNRRYRFAICAHTFVEMGTRRDTTLYKAVGVRHITPVIEKLPLVMGLRISQVCSAVLPANLKGALAMRLVLLMQHFHRYRWTLCPFVGQLVVGAACLSMPLALSAQQPLQLTVHWDKITVVSKSTPTLQVVVNPRLEHGEPLSTAAYKAVKPLHADYVRYVPWLPYPRLAVAELQPPTSTKTSWDFSLIDPMTKDFLAATAGHPTVMNFSTTPAWLYKTDKPVTYPADPNQAEWHYTQGTELRDPSGRELGDYYARLVSWYINGGFIDELGAKHVSGYHYKFPVWEVLNEIEAEHTMSPQQYTERYDVIVSAIHKVSPETKFMGLALAAPSSRPDFFEYFLNPTNHKPGTPLDYI